MPAGKTYVKIATTTLGSAASSVTFSSISGNYTDLILVATVKLTSSNTDRLFLQFNGDTGTNYSATYLQGDGSAAASGRFSSVAEMRFYNQSTADFYPNIIHIMNYANSTTYKTAIGRTSAAGISATATVGLWRSTAAITQVDVKSPNTFTSGSTFTLYGIAASKAPKAIGGTITTDGSYWIHTFTSSGLFIPQESIDNVDYLVVAGGGGSDKENGGGGGAGGLRSTVTATGGGGSLESKLSLAMSTNYTVTVGAGGAASGLNAGSNSVFSTITSTGGGYGGNAAGGSGGSGGGAGGDVGSTTSGGAGTANQGYAGGTATVQSKAPSAGGGGAGAVGGNNASNQGGNGGIGVAVSISGASTYYAGGGGGGVETGGTAGTGGTGGGGAGSNTNLSTPTSGTANTGGGAGGSSGLQNSPGAQGGSGIVIVRYPV